MNWQDEGFLLSKIKFRENANIVNVFTNIRGKVSGIIYGGTSRKIRNFLQISNKIFVIYSSKSPWVGSNGNPDMLTLIAIRSLMAGRVLCLYHDRNIT